MPGQNIEMIRVAYDVAYAQRSVSGVRDRFAEDFVWHSRPEWPGKATYSADELPELWADLDETFSEFELVAFNFEEVGDEYVLVKVRQSMSLRESEARFETTVWHLWRIEDVPKEGWVFINQTEALKAAGVPE
jgi:hypothetical protein